jgi:hypothetical protein
MNDLEITGGRVGQGRGSLTRMVRTGVTLFSGGFLSGLVVALVFHALITTLVVVAAVIVVLVAAARMMLGRRRS